MDQMLARDFGTLSSATGSGKTIMALYMIAQRRQPTQRMRRVDPPDRDDRPRGRARDRIDDRRSILVPTALRDQEIDAAPSVAGACSMGWWVRSGGAHRVPEEGS